MPRIGLICGLCAPALGLALLLSAPEAQAGGSQAQVFSACEEQMKAEFGEAEFKFNKFRRSENKDFAFGEMTLTDGSTKRVRCHVQRGTVRGVTFRNGNKSGRLEGGFWTNDRPPGAEFVPPAPEEEENTSGQSDDETAAVSPDAEDQTDAAATEDTDAADQPEASDQPEATDAENTDSETAQSEDGEQSETAESESEDGPKRVTPVFKRVN